MTVNPAPMATTTTGPRITLAQDALAVLPVWVVARLLVGTAWLVAAAVGDDRTRIDQGLLAWDGDWYRKIADVGYANVEPDGLRFLALFPFLGQIPGVVVGNRFGLLLVANAAAFAAMVALRRLVRRDFGTETALDQRVTWLMALFPTGFVFVWAYTEALFVLLAVLFFWDLRGERPARSAAAGVLAGACRPFGVLLAVPAAVEAWQHWRTHRKLPVAMVGAMVSPVVGLGLHSLVLSVAGRDWDAAWNQQSGSRGALVDPITRLLQGIGDLAGDERFGDGLHLPFAVAFIALLVAAARRLPLSYLAYAATVVLVAISAENLNSLERYALSGFPIVIALAFLTRQRNRLVLVAAGSGALMVALTVLAWLGEYVP